MLKWPFQRVKWPPTRGLKRSIGITWYWPFCSSNCFSNRSIYFSQKQAPSVGGCFPKQIIAYWIMTAEDSIPSWEPTYPILFGTFESMISELPVKGGIWTCSLEGSWKSITFFWSWGHLQFFISQRVIVWIPSCRLQTRHLLRCPWFQLIV